MLAGRDGNRLQAVSAQIGQSAEPFTFDLRRSGDADAVVEHAVRQLGGLDGVINAAGVVAFGSLAELTDPVLDELIATDLSGPLRVIRAAIPHLAGGFIVSITGLVAEQPVANMSAYSAVKAGLSAATRALVRELRAEGVLVLDARPPHTETGLAGRPIAGTSPPLPVGLDPAAVAETIVQGIETGRRDLAAADFGT